MLIILIKDIKIATLKAVNIFLQWTCNSLVFIVGKHIYTAVLKKI